MFAAFFAGSAGCGQFWHWDHQYVDGNNLWWQFRRFANAIDGLDPIAEDFRPFYTESRRLRMYGLRGKRQPYLAQLKTKLGAFEQLSKTRSAIHLTLVTSAGFLRNKHSGIVHSEVTLDDLFRA